MNQAWRKIKRSKCHDVWQLTSSVSAWASKGVVRTVVNCGTEEHVPFDDTSPAVAKSSYFSEVGDLDFYMNLLNFILWLLIQILLRRCVGQKTCVLDFPGGAVVKNPPANAGDMGSIPGPGRSHMPRSN